MIKKTISLSRTYQNKHVLPPDTNNKGTLFGGKLMSYIDEIASLAAIKHCRKPVVTASADSVDFLHPIKQGSCVSLEAYVTWTRTTSMEVVVKVISEELLTGKQEVCAISFLTFVALDHNNKPVSVPGVYPETEEEKMMHDTAEVRAKARQERRQRSKELAQFIKKPTHNE